MHNIAAEKVFHHMLEQSQAKLLTQADIESQGLVPYTFIGGPGDGSVMYVPDGQCKGEAGCLSPCGLDSSVLAIHTYLPDAQSRRFVYNGAIGFIEPN